MGIGINMSFCFTKFMRRSLVAFVAAFVSVGLLGGCSTMEDMTDFDTPELPSLPKFSNPFAKPEAKLPGERISVMTAKRGGGPDMDVSEATAITALPAITVNTGWTQPGGKPDNAMGHLALTGSLSTRWSADAGRGSNKRSRVVASPIVYNGKVFTLDSRGRVSAFSQSSGGRVWSRKITPATENDYEGYGGGLAIGDGRLYVATGYGRVYGLDPNSGNELWVKSVGEPVRSSPTSSDGKIFTTTALGSFICLNGEDGTELWRYQGLPESASLITNASPAVSGGLVIAPYPSGELIAFDIESGQPVWTETLSSSRSNSSLSALRNASRPVVSNGVVYAVGHGGRMIASSLKTGERLWMQNIKGVQAPWVAGGMVYVVDVSGELMALTAKSGKLVWRTKLPGGGRWSGPVLAGGKLWAVSTKGMIVGVDGKLGSVTAKRSVGSKMGIAPVIASGQMYVLTDKAKLLAFN
ncbi:MAG: pyrrolo-quinoline quinone [Rhodomicrobium sp.]|nr:MAG: pyrrolo-quinoline quinone [Rhodomicrobium sp.]